MAVKIVRETYMVETIIQDGQAGQAPIVIESQPVKAPAKQKAKQKALPAPKEHAKGAIVRVIDTWDDRPNGKLPAGGRFKSQLG